MYDVLAIVSIAIVALGVLLSILGPGIAYEIPSPADGEVDSPEFMGMLESLADAKINPRTKIEVLTNGENFYEAELEAIRGAARSVNIEAYIFQTGRVTKAFVAALTERARAGVKVNLVIDAVGSMSTRKSMFSGLTQAGGRVRWFHPLRPRRFFQFNNRTHREIMVVDGRIGFVGGAGIADHWRYGRGKDPRWRDTMVRLEGDAVSNLQGTFAENWLEACGEILVGEDYFPQGVAAGEIAAMIVNGTPGTGGSSRARMLFQIMVASARKSIHITTPYFLPDKSLRRELVRAMRERGVEITVLVPGTKSDHMLTRTSSRKFYGQILKNGARVFEYQPAMIHAKILMIDGKWSIVGSTNFDPRSFGINDEVNLAALNQGLAARLEQDFASDLGESKQMSYEKWKRRPVLERGMEWLGWLIGQEQ